MTETCGIITSIGGHFFIDRPESAGPATPVYEVKVVDDDGNALPVGQEPSVMVSAVALGRLR
jgi:long-chain acyl-CoA synthetase